MSKRESIHTENSPEKRSSWHTNNLDCFRAGSRNHTSEAYLDSGLSTLSIPACSQNSELSYSIVCNLHKEKKSKLSTLPSSTSRVIYNARSCVLGRQEAFRVFTTHNENVRVRLELPRPCHNVKLVRTKFQNKNVSPEIGVSACKK